MNRALACFALAFALPWLPAEAAAQVQPLPDSAARADDIVAVLRGQRPATEVFSPAFLMAVPAAQLAALIEGIEREHGKLAGIAELKQLAPFTAQFQLRFERASAATIIQLEPGAPGRVIGLRITSVTPLGDHPAKVLADFQALGAGTGFGLYRLDGAAVRPILTHRPSAQLAIGSTFKLWVLEAVAAEVAAKRLRWDQVVRLGLRSVPSGITQDWPARAAVTVETLATLMISRSDNTATDGLIRLVGRDRIAARVRALGHGDPARMLPLLTTLEAFTLKADPNGIGREYAAASEAEQAAVLARIGPKLDPAKIHGALPTDDRPAAIETIEWFASAQDIAGVLNALRQRSDPTVLAILGVSPALPPDQRARFARIGYKGGSEPGVINLSYVLQDTAGQWFVVTGSWNDPAAPIEERRFEQLMLRLVSLIP